MDDFAAAAVLVLLLTALFLWAVLRLNAYWLEFGASRHRKVLLSRQVSSLKSGDVLFFSSYVRQLPFELLTGEPFTHAAMVVRGADGELYLTEAVQQAPPLAPPGTPEPLPAFPAAAVLLPLAPRLAYEEGGVFLMALRRPLEPEQEAVLRQRAAESCPYPGFAEFFLEQLFGALAPQPRRRHCMQHVAWLLDEMGLPPAHLALRGQPFLPTCKLFGATRKIAELGRKNVELCGGAAYTGLVELVVDLVAAELVEEAAPPALSASPQ